MNALYPAKVTHARLRPRPHRLKYTLPYLLLELTAPPPRLRWFSRNRFNLFSLRDGDYGDGVTPPEAYAARLFSEAGLAAAAAHIWLLTVPRFLGLGFNPISLYLGHDAAGRLRAVLYEVNNTFGQRHCYLVPVPEDARPPLLHGCAKALHVSPFMAMAQHYAFRLTPPGPALGLHITVTDADGPLLRASMAAAARRLSDPALLRLALATPWLGVKILAAIHWQALRLWLKGLAFHPSPAAPKAPVTVMESRP